jgi:hypothetical protein
MLPDLTTARGLLAYAKQLEEQTARLRARAGCADRKAS